MHADLTGKLLIALPGIGDPRPPLPSNYSINNIKVCGYYRPDRIGAARIWQKQILTSNRATAFLLWPRIRFPFFLKTRNLSVVPCNRFNFIATDVIFNPVIWPFYLFVR